LAYWPKLLVTPAAACLIRDSGEFNLGHPT